tara:strand:+ start:97 stop:651 length:555 start_codon:yes stop_codon:yes gene_type:complete
VSLTKLRVSKIALVSGGIVVFLVGFGTAFLLVQSFDTKAEIDESSTTTKFVEAGPKIIMNGRPIKGQFLLQAYADNPNRFNVRNAKADFTVTGKIAKIGEISSLDEISGFYVPLDMEYDAIRFDFAKKGKEPPPESISIWLMEIDENRASEMVKGQEISVRCKKVRVVGEGLAFGACLELEKKI